MSIQSGGPAPYAPSGAVLGFIEAFRNKPLPTKVAADVLKRIGIGDSLIPRTLKSLELLSLIDGDNSATPTLLGLRTATQEEYPARLRAIVEDTYAEVLRFVDLPNDDPVRVADQFRVFQPIGMRPRMVSLFYGLLEAAGMEFAQPPKRMATTSQKPKAPRGQAPRAERETRSNQRTNQSSPGRVTLAMLRRSDNDGSLPPAVAGMLRSLPPDGSTWTPGQYEAFMAAFGSILKFCYPIEEAPRVTEGVLDEDAE